MADTETVVAMSMDEHEFVDDGEIITETVQTDDVTDDILQQALEQASDTFEGKVVYTDENGVIIDSVGVNEEELGIVAESEHLTISLNSGDFMTKQTMTYTIGDTGSQSDNVVNAVSTIPSLSAPIVNTPQPEIIDGPLGSSANPIRIVQQGNQYVSMQQLNTEQVQQIMHVLQQQQVAKQTQLTDSPTVLYNPNTNTKVVYRVIQPSELHSKSTGDVLSHPKRTARASNVLQVDASTDSMETKRKYRKRRNEDEDDRIDAPELSREEKEEKKKHRPRTRSGRVSKPPKHMVKDYKHIHPVDWDEDYDDSDGGYSDFRESEEEDLEGLNSKDSTYTHPGLGSNRTRPFKCETCGKGYIGHKGLNRHYLLNPTHGQAVAETDTGDATENGGGGEGSNDSTEKAAETPAPSVSQPTPYTRPTRGAHIPSRGRGRGRPPLFNTDAPTRRKLRLKDMVRQCEDEELMEIVLPRLVKSVSSWEFMMMKCEKGKPARPDVKHVYKEFESLLGQMKSLFKEKLTLVADLNTSANSDSQIQVTNPGIAQVLDLQVGAYNVQEAPLEEDDIPMTYKFLVGNSSASTITPNTTSTPKRSIQFVTPDELVDVSAAKRPRISYDSNNLPLSTMPVIVSSSAPTELEEPSPVINTVSSIINMNGDSGKEVLGQKEVVDNSQEVLGQTNTIFTQDGQIMSVASDEHAQLVIGSQNNILQTSEGIVVIRNPDGTVSLQGFGEQEIPLETVQALLAMEADGQAQIHLAEHS